MKKNRLGITALLIGIVALGLAVIPGLAMERPEERPETPPLIESESDGGVTLTFKEFSVTWGGKSEEGEEVAEQAVNQEEPIDRNRLLKWFTLSAVCFSLVGLVLGPISWARERQPAISGSAIGVCCLALVWQYVVIGIAVGVGIAVLLIVLSQFSP